MSCYRNSQPSGNGRVVRPLGQDTCAWTTMVFAVVAEAPEDSPTLNHAEN